MEHVVAPESSKLGWIKYTLNQLEGPEPFNFSGKIPRILPKTVREPPSPQEFQTLLKTLLDWETKVASGVKTTSGLSSVAKTSLTFTIYTFPAAPLTSLEIEIAAKLLFQIWIFDCLVEDLMRENNNGNGKGVFKDVSLVGSRSFREIQFAVKIFESQLLTGQTPDLPKEDLDPRINVVISLLDSVVKLVWSFGANNHPNWGHVASEIIEYYSVMETYMVRPMCFNVGFRTFTFFRSKIGVALGLSTLHFVLGEGFNSQLRENVYKHPAFKKLGDSANILAQACNDLLGVKRDILDDDLDSHVRFIVESEGVPLVKAGEKVEMIIKEEFQDYFLMKEVVKTLFPGDEGLERFLDYFDWYVDGAFKMYLYTERYNVQDSVEFGP